MLLLKRRRDQIIRIGADVVVRIVRIEPGAVVLGIEAPPEKLVNREEDLKPEPDRIDTTNQEPPQR